MKRMHMTLPSSLPALLVGAGLVAGCTGQGEQAAGTLQTYAQTTEIPQGILTPDEVETSIGTLNFFDGAPLPATVDLVYDNLDRMRGVDVFLKCMPAASVRQLMLGPQELGADRFNKVLIMDGLLDSKPLFLTGNTSTLYVLPVFDLKTDGATVIESTHGKKGLGGEHESQAQGQTDTAHCHRS